MGAVRCAGRLFIGRCPNQWRSVELNLMDVFSVAWVFRSTENFARCRRVAIDCARKALGGFCGWSGLAECLGIDFRPAPSDYQRRQCIGSRHTSSAAKKPATREARHDTNRDRVQTGRGPCALTLRSRLDTIDASSLPATRVPIGSAEELLVSVQLMQPVCRKRPLGTACDAQAYRTNISIVQSGFRFTRNRTGRQRAP